MIDHQLLELKKAGIKWGILECFSKALSEMKVAVPHSIKHDLKQARSTIGTGCYEYLGEAERLISNVETVLAQEGRSTRNKSVKEYMNLLEKMEGEMPNSEEIAKIPFMEDLIRKHEFLSYCIFCEA